ncbi:MAG: hypothetical protein ACQEXQ_22745 [Bacillota bacterium]
MMKFQLVDVNGVPVISLPAGYDLLEAFIGTNLQDINEDGHWLIDTINEVLDDKVESATLGDVKYFIIQLDKNNVKIIDPYSEDESYCELLTSVFKDIIVNWLKQKDRYYAELR